ncbi:MAG: hypothetical protein V2G51_06840 [bacterium JZ-2024 1]
MPNLKIISTLRLNVLDILESDKILITSPALDQIERVWAK